MHRLLRASQLVLVGIGVAILYWIVESYLDTLVLEATFAERLTPEDPNELWMRLTIVGLLVGFGFYGQSLVNERRRVEEALREARDELEARVEERTAELTRANEELRTEVAERERAQNTLRESEERYRLLVESVKDYAVFMLDTEGRVADWNAGAERLFGYEDGEIVGRPGSVLFTSEDAERRMPERELERALGEGRGEDERWYVRKDGTRFWASGFVRPVRDEEGNLRGFAKVARDITRRKRNENALRFMAEAGAELASSLDYRGTLSKVARLAVPALADWCAMDVVEEDGSLERLAVVHENPEKVALARRLREGYPPDPDAPYGVPEVLRTGEPELVPEIPEELLDRAARDEGHREILRGLGLKSYLVVPLVARGRTLGALTLVTAESGRRYGEADLKLAEELARRAALAVDNARLYEEAKREIAERERTEERFRLLVEGVTDYAILMLTPDGRVASWNPGARRILGYEEEEILGEHFSLFFTEEDRRSGRPQHELEQAVTQGRASNENWAVRKDGNRFWASGVTTALLDLDGNLRGLAKILRDMTEHKRAEQALREVRDAERSRMARDLHDGALQDISYALVEMEIVRMVPNDPDAGARLEQAIATLRGASRDLRATVNDLRLGEEQNRPLRWLVESLVQRSRGMAPDLEIELVVEDAVPSAPLGDAGTELLRVLQEALNNVRRHSRARHVLVSLRTEGDDLVAEVSDDGRGFGPDTPTGIGLRSMRERAESLGGELVVESEPGKGTRVRLRAPMQSLLRESSEIEPDADEGNGSRI